MPWTHLPKFELPYHHHHPTRFSLASSIHIQFTHRYVLSHVLTQGTILITVLMYMTRRAYHIILFIFVIHIVIFVFIA